MQRVSPEHLDQVLHPQFEARATRSVLATGLAASPGAGVGRAYFDADDAVAAADRGEPVDPGAPGDLARGRRTACRWPRPCSPARGGLVSHAAVVARGWGMPAVVGAESARRSSADQFTAGDVHRPRGRRISVDGTHRRGHARRARAGGAPSRRAEFDVILDWADDVRRERLGVRANADTGADAARAREFGAEGIGLCRTEHMFLGDRLPVVQRMILADTPETEDGGAGRAARGAAADFEEILEAMDGLPVTVRLLDPPLHEFLPDIEELIAQATRGASSTKAGRELFAAARAWQEQNPMLGTRGVRLGIVKAGPLQDAGAGPGRGRRPARRRPAATRSSRS